MDSNLPTAVTADIPLRMVVDIDRTVDVPCTLDYRAEEPFAVRATFRTGVADIEWSFARDLLAEGMTRPSGEGDIVIWPETGHRTQLVLMALNSPSGQAVLEADREVVAAFLNRTYDLVPAGTESVELDIDRWISQILGEGLRGV